MSREKVQTKLLLRTNFNFILHLLGMAKAAGISASANLPISDVFWKSSGWPVQRQSIANAGLLQLFQPLDGNGDSGLTQNLPISVLFRNQAVGGILASCISKNLARRQATLHVLACRRFNIWFCVGWFGRRRLFLRFISDFGLGAIE